jgi:hypothetical protein
MGGNVSPVLLVVVSLVFLFAPTQVQSEVLYNDLDGLATALVTHGFENVLVTGEPQATVQVYYENRIYRYQLKAMGVVLALVNNELTAPWTAEIIPLKAGVSVVSVTASSLDYVSFISGEVDEKTFSASLVISTDPSVPDLHETKNGSFRRLDISAGPMFTVELEQVDDALHGQFNIVPQVEADLAKGFLATAQLVVPLVDEFETKSSGVRPGRVTLDWLHRHGPAVGLFRVGIFNPDRYGVSLGAGRWAWGDRLLLVARGDVTGTLVLIDGVWEYSSADVFTYSVEAQYRYPLLDVACKASFGRFLGEEVGGRLDIMRALGELEIGFFAIKTESESLGGILVDLPLPLTRYSKPSPIRFRTVPTLTWEYRGEVTRSGHMPGGGLSIEKLYRGLAPTFIRNNVSEWMDAAQYI